MSRRSIALFAVVVLALTSSCAKKFVPPDVLMIVVDTLREDRLSCYGAERETSPAIDAFAASGVLFENAYAPAPWTKPSIASILTGKYPSGHGVLTVNHQLSTVTIAERFQAAGYATAGVVSNHVISKFDRGFEAYDTSEAVGGAHMSSRGVTVKAIERMRELAAGEAPFFLFVHYFDPHVDYLEHSEVKFPRGPVGRLNGKQSWTVLFNILDELTPEELQYVRDLYDGEIRYTDHFVKKLVEELDRLEIADNTIVALTADHGEELMDHGKIGHTRALFEELIRVPLIVRAPGVPAGLRFEQPVTLVSLVPTILDLARVPANREEFQSVSLAERLLSGKDSESETSIFAEVDFEPEPSGRMPVPLTRMKSLMVGRFKIVHDELLDTYTVFDLVADPDERVDIASEDPERLASLRKKLEFAIEQAKRNAAAAKSEELSPEEIQQLEDLGYL